MAWRRRHQNSRIHGKRRKHNRKANASLSLHLRMERGVISIFLCGVLLLMSVSSAIFMDYARITLARAESRSAMKMLSHAALSGFDKTVAREFGLFAVQDVSRMQEQTEELLAQRFPPDTASIGVRLYAPRITVTPSDNARLSRPEVMTTQIKQFMAWQIPGIALEKALQQVEMMKKLSVCLPAFQSKIQYEMQLHSVQQAINACFDKVDNGKNLLPPGMKAIALPASLNSLSTESKAKLFAGVPAPASAEKVLSDGARQLDVELLRRLQKGVNEHKKVPSQSKEWEKLLSVGDRAALKSAFLTWRGKYLTVSSWFDRLIGDEHHTLTALQNTAEKMNGLTASKENWQDAVSQLPPGAVTQSMLGDYLSATDPFNPEKLNQLKEEWKRTGEKTKDLAQAWKALSLDRMPLEELSFESWLSARLTSIKRHSETTFTLPKTTLFTTHPPGWSDGIALSEESIQTQADLIGQRNDDRSGFIEFLKAWNTKRKALANARKAKRMGMPNLSGGITDFLAPDVLQRYEADAHSAVYEEWMPPEGNEMDMLNGMMQATMRLADLFSGLSFANAGDTVSLLTYWANMFSHRTTPLIEKEEGHPLLSLTGFPLAERPIFGGELEYILYGRPYWFENIQQAENHILVIRLLCNMLYAFTSSELNAETAQLALALAGWTGFAVPLVQSALLAVLAVGETAVDMDALTAGERVAVIKTQDTWHFSLSGVAQLAKKASHDVFDVLTDESLAALEAGGDTLEETVGKMKDSLIQKANDAVHQPVLRMMEMGLLEADSISDKEQQAKITQALQQLASRGGEGKMGIAVSNAFSRLSAQSAALGQVLTVAKEKKKQAGKATEEVLEQIRKGTETIVNQACQDLSSFADEGIVQLEKKLQGILDENTATGKEEAVTALATFEAEMGGGDAVGSMTAGAGLTMSYGDYMLLLMVIHSSSRAGRESMLSQTARLVQAESGGTDLTTAPTSLDWLLESQVNVPFLPQFRASTLLNATGKQVDVKENWQEGYGLKKDNL
ncbi:DUF5702 domain-containing protein [Murdochiella massiliensis]|uniref:DUF5702 domain-containing protein n=1 Tax=Murdochiella massiliensis TaxID=1673723 RepID=UPI000831D4C0|nr:DUF5702 domain-containing protein [Murdochiella massiliensis]